jgi:hypothetical protein
MAENNVTEQLAQLQAGLATLAITARRQSDQGEKP